MEDLNNSLAPPYDNPVIFTFNFKSGDFVNGGLDNFDEILLTLVEGGTVYSNVSTPENLFTTSETELRLKIGNSTPLDAGMYTPTIWGVSADYPNGFLLTSERLRPLFPICIL